MKNSIPEPAQIAPGRLMSIGDVTRETGLHRATIYRRIAEGRFPRGVLVSYRKKLWAERDVEAWKRELLDSG